MKTPYMGARILYRQWGLSWPAIVMGVRTYKTVALLAFFSSEPHTRYFPEVDLDAKEQRDGTWHWGNND